MPVEEDQLECATCGAVVKLHPDEEEAVDDAEEDPEDAAIPEGWVTVTARRRIPNPDWVDLQQRRDLVRQVLGTAPPDAPPEIHQAAAQQAELVLSIIPVDVEPWGVDEIVEALCPDCSKALQTKLDFPDWEDLGEDEEEDEE